MKKIISIMLTALLLTGLVVTAVAAEQTTCTVSADTVTAVDGQVTVPIRISENPGFTNFGIALDYDRDALELVSINTADGETTYLCGELAAVNVAWNPAADGNAAGNTAFAANQTYGYVTCASAEAVTENDILFTATFTVREGFESGTAAVTPIVSYVRNNAAVFSVFEEITATVETGAVTTGLLGDVNGDGEITPVDAAMTYSIANGKLEATEARCAAADVNGDGEIGPVDAAMIYSYANGKLAKFPAAS